MEQGDGGFALSQRELQTMHLHLESIGFPTRPAELAHHLQWLAAARGEPELPERFIHDVARHIVDFPVRIEPMVRHLAIALHAAAAGAAGGGAAQATLPASLPVFPPPSPPVFVPCCGVCCRGGFDFTRLLNPDKSRPAALNRNEMEVDSPTDPSSFFARAQACSWSSGKLAETQAGGAEAQRRVPLRQAYGTTDAASQQCAECYALERRLRESYEACLGPDGEFLTTGAPGWKDAQCTDAMRRARSVKRTRERAAQVARATAALQAAQAAEDANDKLSSENAMLRRRLAEQDKKITELIALRGKVQDDNGKNDVLIDMLSAVLGRGILKEGHFAYRLIKNQLAVALAPSGHSVRWDSDIVEWATCLYVHGNETVIRLLDGGMFRGRGQKKDIDYGRCNWAMPSLTTIRRRLAAHNLTLGEGINPAAVLKAQDICTLLGVTPYIVLSFDETPLARGAALCPHTNMIKGLAGGPIKVSDIEQLDAKTLKFLSHVDAVHIHTAFVDTNGKELSINVGYFAGSAETDDKGKPQPLSATVLRDMRAGLRSVCTCRHCLLNGCTDCTASGPGSVCSNAQTAGAETFCFGVLGIAGDSGGGNKQAMRALVEEGAQPDPAPPAEGEGGEAAAALTAAEVLDAALRRIIRQLFTFGDPVHGLKNLYCHALNYLARLETQRFSIKLLLDIFECNPGERARLAAAGVTLEMLTPHDKHEWKHIDTLGSQAVKDAGYVVHTMAGAPDQRGCNDDRRGLTESWQKPAGKYARLDTPRRIVVDTTGAIVFAMLQDRVLSINMKPDGCIKRLTMLPGAAGLGLLRDRALLATTYVDGKAKIYNLSRVTKGEQHGTKTEVEIRDRVGNQEVKDLGFIPGICSAGVWPMLEGGRGGGEERVVLVDASNHNLLLCERIPGSNGTFYLKVTKRIGGTGVGAGCAVGSQTQVRFSLPQAACYVPGEGAQADRLVVADTGNNRICVVDLNTFITTVLAGDAEAGMADAVGAAARFNQPMDVTYCAHAKGGPAVYVADCNNNRLRALALGTQAVTTHAGCELRGVRNGVARLACFDHPTCLAADGETVFAADGDGHTLRIVCRVDDEMVRFLELLANLRELYTKRDVAMARREALVDAVRTTLESWADCAAATAGHSAKGLTGAHGIGGFETRDSLILAGTALKEFIVRARALSASAGKEYVVNIIALTTLALERDFSCIKRFARTTAPRLVDYESGYTLHFMTRCKRYTGSGGSFRYADANNGAYGAVLREAFTGERDAAQPPAAVRQATSPADAAALAAARGRLEDATGKAYSVVAYRGKPAREPAIPPAYRTTIERRLKELHVTALAKQKSLRQSFYHVKVGAEPRGPALARADAAFEPKEQTCARALLLPPTIAGEADSADAAGAGAEPEAAPSMRQLAEEAQHRLEAAVGDGSDPAAALQKLRQEPMFGPLLAQMGEFDGADEDDKDADPAALADALEATRASLVAAEEAAAAAKPKAAPPLELHKSKRARTVAPAPQAPPLAALLAETDAERAALTVPQLKVRLAAMAAVTTDKVTRSGNKPELLAELSKVVTKHNVTVAGRTALEASSGAAPAAAAP